MSLAADRQPVRRRHDLVHRRRRRRPDRHAASRCPPRATTRSRSSAPTRPATPRPRRPRTSRSTRRRRRSATPSRRWPTGRRVDQPGRHRDVHLRRPGRLRRRQLHRAGHQVAPRARTAVTGTATDSAGNTASDTRQRQHRQDRSPTITADGRPAPERRRLVQRRRHGQLTPPSDALSGVGGTPGDDVLGEGANQTASGTVTDAAGNSASAGVTGINVDKTAPVLTGVLPERLAHRRRHRPLDLHRRRCPASTGQPGRHHRRRARATTSPPPPRCTRHRRQHGHQDGRRHQDRPHRADHDRRPSPTPSAAAGTATRSRSP